MDPQMEKVAYILAVALITWIVQMIWKNFGEMSSAKEERRSTARRLNDLETEVKDFRKMFSDIGRMEAVLGQINQSQTKISDKLEKLGIWQATHQPVIEDAKKFIDNANRDGVRVKP